ncbi:uncharacterized protein LOC120778233 [Bactrocera tryoni]|uniref:uncharacterized protein LOC120778233 n=1 Tax=Bactrocera tryoni TaxID=59916 RepID=UPI001A98AB79|nr:uncharacterized protein LOC120778233 [Bactrocera tryoni]
MHLQIYMRFLVFQFSILGCFAINQYQSYDDVPSSTDRNFYTNSLLCMDIKPQHSVDIGQITGMWYGSEIIIHTQDIPGIYEYDSCVIIHLNDITEQMLNHYNNQQYTQQYNQRRTQNGQQQQQHIQNANNERNSARYLRLIWSESEKNLEYMFNYTERSPGLWTNIGEQRGSLVALNSYNQFTGTVQVVKAVNDHLVLTFCGNDLSSSIYTLVLSRTEKGLSIEELRSIRNLLSRRGLHTETIRKVCSSAASSPAIMHISFLTLLGVFAMLKFYY